MQHNQVFLYLLHPPVQRYFFTMVRFISQAIVSTLAPECFHLNLNRPYPVNISHNHHQPFSAYNPRILNSNLLSTITFLLTRSLWITTLYYQRLRQFIMLRLLFCWKNLKLRKIQLTPREGWVLVQTDAGCAWTLSEQSDGSWVTPEVSDVLFHPLKGKDLILHAEISRDDTVSSH